MPEMTLECSTLRPRAGGTMNTTGSPSSTSAIGPCLSSPAAKLGEGVGDLLELQRAFHGDRIPHMTSEEQEGLRVHHLLGGFLHGLGLGVEDPLDFAGHVLQRVQSLGDFVSIHGALDLGQIQAEHVCGGDLRHERLVEATATSGPAWV